MHVEHRSRFENENSREGGPVKMFRRYLRQVEVLLLMTTAFAVSGAAASFSKASLKGSYSFLIDRWTASVYTEQFAMVGIVTFNGAGGVTGSYTSVTGGVAGAGALVGTYTVNSNGTGAIDFTTGSTAHFAVTLNSTVAGVAHGVELLRINDSSNEVISGTAVLQSTASARYSVASLSGNFAFQYNTSTAEMSQAEEGGTGVISFNGKGSLSISETIVQGGVVHTYALLGTYTVNSDGIARVSVAIKGNSKYAAALNSVAAGQASGLQFLGTNPANSSYILSGTALKQ
jgi:hypothetical protein